MKWPGAQLWRKPIVDALWSFFEVEAAYSLKDKLASSATMRTSHPVKCRVQEGRSPVVHSTPRVVLISRCKTCRAKVMNWSEVLDYGSFGRRVVVMWGFISGYTSNIKIHPMIHPVSTSSNPAEEIKDWKSWSEWSAKISGLTSRDSVRGPVIPLFVLLVLNFCMIASMRTCWSVHCGLHSSLVYCGLHSS